MKYVAVFPVKISIFHGKHTFFQPLWLKFALGETFELGGKD